MGNIQSFRRAGAPNLDLGHAGIACRRVATIALTVLGHARPMAAVLRWFEIPCFQCSTRSSASSLSVLVSWVLFT